ncbi:late embryogenesis abundant protein At5g17165-like [Silene latifolia]|uniref:late embryogenesis abundant protein At5g17165-like n=1 Tax=Silene latifolia TaxID=37657 RepID=UPI003D78777A
MHGLVYDKNVEDHVRPVLVPDDIIQPQSDKYWSPNPHTGVFGPATEHNLGVGERGYHTSAGNGRSESVLEQKAFFRPQEDLDKPEQA